MGDKSVCNGGGCAVSVEGAGSDHDQDGDTRAVVDDAIQPALNVDSQSVSISQHHSVTFPSSLQDMRAALQRLPPIVNEWADLVQQVIALQTRKVPFTEDVLIEQCAKMIEAPWFKLDSLYQLRYVWNFTARDAFVQSILSFLPHQALNSQAWEKSILMYTAHFKTENLFLAFWELLCPKFDEEEDDSIDDDFDYSLCTCTEVECVCAKQYFATKRQEREDSRRYEGERLAELVNAQSPEGDTALTIACLHGTEQMCQSILDCPHFTNINAIGRNRLDARSICERFDRLPGIARLIAAHPQYRRPVRQIIIPLVQRRHEFSTPWGL